MGYTAVPTVNTGDSWTARDCNVYFKDNFAAGIPDLMTTKGDLVAATGEDAADRLAVGTDGYYLTALSSASVGLGWCGFERLGADVGDMNLCNNTSICDPQYKQLTSYSENYDTGSNMASSTFTAQHAGYYVVTCNGVFDHSTSGFFDTGTTVNIAVYVNGAIYSVIGRATIQRGGNDFMCPLTMTDVIYLDQGDTLKYYVGWTDETIGYTAVLEFDDFNFDLCAHYVAGG